VAGLNVDACRIQYVDEKINFDRIQLGTVEGTYGYQSGIPKFATPLYKSEGRWPANVILDEDAAQQLDSQSGVLKTGAHPNGFKRNASSSYRGGFKGQSCEEVIATNTQGDSGGASRFFYCSKAGKKERIGNDHPTVKPIKLMSYLLKLIVPPGGTVLDPFAGSGTTAVAAKELGFNCIGIELSQHNYEIILGRLADGDL
jgi:site-specific DNA-methyltransferase (adenine-specific)